MTDERLKQLMEQVGFPDSKSLYTALRQCHMEATMAERERCARIAEDWDSDAADPREVAELIRRW